MKIAVIVKTDLTNSKVYTTHKNKVMYHPDKLFLSRADKSAIEYALQWVKASGGGIDAYSFEDGILADRVLHETLAMGVDSATKFTGVNINDPLQANTIAAQFVDYLNKKNKIYDLILTGFNQNSDVLSALIAQKMNFSYYDNVSDIDDEFHFETKLEKGKIKGKFKLPAVISVLDSINTPQLPSFVNLRNALNTSLNTINLNKDDSVGTSKIEADQDKHEKIIFDLNKDPKAIQELVDTLKQNGILK